ncbi:uncharacterized protein ATNIH1004_001357 [Aspergillus tanneri]|uniref:Uncharacterized protein n=1 Tax=Aspergillus tanneri TaxID=1220188 RepID=A0A5M9N5B9_9EURO|nr:uncharacterized protein ATNIH1004_001357 [Aspergillus tanneri]KAA8652453.1 hypothetical protein ATNIH1004_001357 [Aspergillus tanneri]
MTVMLNFYLFPILTLVLVPFLVVSRAVIAYLQTPKGFWKYPVQNYLSAFTKLGYFWEMGCKHPWIEDKVGDEPNSTLDRIAGLCGSQFPPLLRLQHGISELHKVGVVLNTPFLR